MKNIKASKVLHYLSKAWGADLQPSFSAVLIIGLGGLISGCASTPCGTCPVTHPPASSTYPSPTPVVQSQPIQPVARALPSSEVKITAIGYGASSSYEGYTSGQKRLMAMRASKLDAYRALAEQIQGVRVNGNSTVAAMMAQVDGFRVYVDAYLRGAQIVTVTPMADGNYETTMELTLDSRFFNSFLQRDGDIALPPVTGSNIKGAAGPGSAYGSSFYYSN
jgi:hypothetical protein